jgi:SAM-dependent methyltransferase
LNSFKEKRLYPRVACRLRVIPEPGDANIEGVITDLSLDGIRIRTADPVNVGETYHITLNLPSAPKPLKVELKAVQYLGDDLENNGFGFRFSNFNQRDARLLNQFILEQMSLEQHVAIQKIFKHLNDKTIQPLTDSTKIMALLSKAEMNRSAFTIVQEDKSQAVSCLLEEVSSEHLKFNCEDDYVQRNFDISVPLVVVFSTQFTSYYFETFFSAVEERQFQAETPKFIFFPEKRSSAREHVAIPGNVTLEISLPYPEGKVIQREVLDLSSTGLSFKTPAHESYFLPGTPLRQVWVISAGKRIINESAEVKHITPWLEGSHSVFLKVGLEFGVNRQNIVLTQTGLKLDERTGGDRRKHDRRQGVGKQGEQGAAENRQRERRGKDRRQRDLRHNLFQDVLLFTRKIASRGLRYYRNQWVGLTEAEPGPPVNIVTYFNQRREKIVAILNSTAGNHRKIEAPVVLIPPAYGRRKESTGSLALSLVENFKSHQRDIVVLRYDGIRSIGESYKDRSCRFEGKEMINMTLSQGMEDILTTLDFVEDNPYFIATDVIMVSFSLAACMARKAIVSDKKKQVGYWVSAWGAADGQEAIRNSTGGVDFIDNYQKGISCGTTNVLGHLIDNDNFCLDAIKSGMAFLDDAKRDMAKIEIPVTWLYGKHDDWINPDRIRDIMTIKAKGTREIVELPTGHMPTTNEEALEAYQLITKYIWRYLFVEEIDVQKPSQASAIELRNAEWSRTPRSVIKDQTDFWEKYLLGEGQLEVGFDVMAETQEYQEFMGKQIDLLDIHSGQVIGDLGSGTGLFHRVLLSDEKNRSLFQSTNGSPKIITVDLVNSALEKSKSRLSCLAAEHSLNENFFEFRCSNLEVNRLKPIWRFLNGEYFSVAKFKGKIEGLPNYLVDLWEREYSEFLHEILRGKTLDSQDLLRLKKEFSEGESEILLAMNRAARFLLKKLVAEDFKEPQHSCQFLDDYQLGYSKLDTTLLDFGKLNFRNSNLNLSLAFRDSQFDKILCSIVLSYLFNPQETLGEFYRILKAGGKMVISTFRPDVDMSRIYTNLILKIENDPDYVPPNGKDKEDFLKAVRSFANSAAFLLHLEEEGHFKFFSRAELKELLESARFERVEFYDSFGYPPQAYVAVCSK